MNILAAPALVFMIVFGVNSAVGNSVSGDPYNCQPIRYDGVHYNFGLLAEGVACNRTESDWYANITVQGVLGGINILHKSVSISIGDKGHCLDFNLGIISGEGCLQTTLGTIRLYGHLCVGSNCNYTFDVTIFSWSSMRNYQDDYLFFQQRYVWQEGYTAEQYLLEYRAYGQLVPSIITVLADTPKMSQYKCIVPNRPEEGFVSKDSVEMDVFLPHKIKGENTFRCKVNKDHIRLCFNEKKQPYRIYYSGYDVQRILRKGYAYDCRNLKGNSTRTVIPTKGGNYAISGNEDVSDKVSCPFFPPSCE